MNNMCKIEYSSSCSGAGILIYDYCSSEVSVLRSVAVCIVFVDSEVRTIRNTTSNFLVNFLVYSPRRIRTNKWENSSQTTETCRELHKRSASPNGFLMYYCESFESNDHRGAVNFPALILWQVGDIPLTRHYRRLKQHI